MSSIIERLASYLRFVSHFPLSCARSRMDAHRTLFLFFAPTTITSFFPSFCDNCSWVLIDVSTRFGSFFVVSVMNLRWIDHRLFGRSICFVLFRALVAYGVLLSELSVLTTVVCYLEVCSLGLFMYVRYLARLLCVGSICVS